MYTAVALVAADDDNYLRTDIRGCPFDSYADSCEVFGLLLTEKAQEPWELTEMAIL